MGFKIGKAFSKLTKSANKLGKSFRGIRDNLTKKFPFLKKAVDKLSKSLTPEKLVKKLAPLLEKAGLADPKLAGVVNELLKGVKTPKDLQRVVNELGNIAAKKPMADIRMGMPDQYWNRSRNNFIELVAERQSKLVA
ncbi:MAG: hypothetical protein JNK82_19960 [Myxococcaceae bacterium]|nr:hypothetical protein [Myxococcaceae bacterium]